MKIKEKYSLLDDDDKVELINSLNFENYEDKWDLILEVISDKNEYDLARIEALKIIEIEEIPKNVIKNLCDVVFNLCLNENDYDVRNYAYISCRNLINYSIDIKNLMTETVMSEQEDIDIRHNAYSAILKIRSSVEKNNILHMLLNDDIFSKFAKKDLS